MITRIKLDRVLALNEWCKGRPERSKHRSRRDPCPRRTFSNSQLAREKAAQLRSGRKLSVNLWDELEYLWNPESGNDRPQDHPPAQHLNEYTGLDRVAKPQLCFWDFYKLTETPRTVVVCPNTLFTPYSDFLDLYGETLDLFVGEVLWRIS